MNSSSTSTLPSKSKNAPQFQKISSTEDFEDTEHQSALKMLHDFVSSKSDKNDQKDSDVFNEKERNDIESLYFGISWTEQIKLKLSYIIFRSFLFCRIQMFIFS